MHFASNLAKTTDDVNALSFTKNLNVEGMPTANIAGNLWLINMMTIYLLTMIPIFKIIYKFG